MQVKREERRGETKSRSLSGIVGQRGLVERKGGAKPRGLQGVVNFILSCSCPLPPPTPQTDSGPKAGPRSQDQTLCQLNAPSAGCVCKDSEDAPQPSAVYQLLTPCHSAAQRRREPTSQRAARPASAFETAGAIQPARLAATWPRTAAHLLCPQYRSAGYAQPICRFWPGRISILRGCTTFSSRGRQATTHIARRPGSFPRFRRSRLGPDMQCVSLTRARGRDDETWCSRASCPFGRTTPALRPLTHSGGAGSRLFDFAEGVQTRLCISGHASRSDRGTQQEAREEWELAASTRLRQQGRRPSELRSCVQHPVLGRRQSVLATTSDPDSRVWT